MPRYLVACDAGGTMTDVIVVDEEGRSVIGKAPTTPHDESIGYMESLEEALETMGIDPKREGREFGKLAETSIYTGTSMLNTVIMNLGMPDPQLSSGDSRRKGAWNERQAQAIQLSEQVE